MSSPRPAPVLLALMVVLLVLLAGCLGTAAPPQGDDADAGDGTQGTGTSGSDREAADNATSGNGGDGSGTGNGTSDGDSGTAGNGTAGNRTTGNGTGGNTTGNGTVPEHEWPPLSSATIRPGTKIFVDRPGSASDGYCTTNFVFRSKTDGTVYVGTAAHCMHQDVGSKVYAPPDTTYLTGVKGDYIGTVVYSSYEVLETKEDPYGRHTEINDFALIEIDPAMVDKVHPAMVHYGGPVGLTTVADIGFLDKVIYFGDSTLRPGPAAADWHEGLVSGVAGPWFFYTYTVGPGIPGDSGSGVLLGDGSAAGIMVAAAATGESGVTVLATALEFAAENGFDVELQTWELLDDGLLP